MEQEKKDKKKKEKPKKSLKREIFEWVMVFVVAAALAFVVRTFIFEPVRVDGSSMPKFCWIKNGRTNSPSTSRQINIPITTATAERISRRS